MKSLIIANGMFRSGSTFFHSILKKENFVSFYEPMHPQLEVLSKQVHSKELNHGSCNNPWGSYNILESNKQIYSYSKYLPYYYKNRMGSHMPTRLNSKITNLFKSLHLINQSHEKIVCGCFNRAAFVLPDIVNTKIIPNIILVHTTRPSLQIAMSLAKLYQKNVPNFNILAPCQADHWGMSNLFNSIYFGNMHKVGRGIVNIENISFLTKICFICTVVNSYMKSLNPICTLDISKPPSHYLSDLETFFKTVESIYSIKLERISCNEYRQSSLPSLISHKVLSNEELDLLESVGFSEFK